ncbi:hypothetical protein ACFLVS_04895 [Chloroflexota bacterium]
MRVKKNSLEKHLEGILLISQGIEMDDCALPDTLPASGYSLEFWAELWKCSIILSILTHRWPQGLNAPNAPDPHELNDYIDRFIIDDFFKEVLQRDIERKAKNRPSYYMCSILAERSMGEIQKFLRSTRSVADLLSDQYITHGVSVFIDAVD